MAHPYCTVAAVQAELPHLASFWGEGNVPDDTQIEALIEEGDQVIDSYLAPRFDCPLTAPPEIIGRISRDLAVARIRYLVFCDSPEPDRNGPAIEKRAMDLLKAIAAGDAALDPAGVAQASTTAGEDRSAVGSWPTTETPIFEQDTNQW